MEELNPILIEVACKHGFNKQRQRSEVVQLVHAFIESREKIRSGTVFSIPVLHVANVQICCDVDQFNCRATLQFNFYTLLECVGEEETVQQGEDEVNIANHWLLPSAELHGLWESLIYDFPVKENILNFVETTLLFSRKSINPNLVACNRLALLHGPPGTGKTSLCKAIAQKLAIRLNATYTHSHLIEINSHSLFSRWFSESGKLVQKVFAHINDLVQDRQSLVCVLIDEVESIAYARDAISSNEPSDSIRVVNAVLTQLDRIRRYPNVFIFSTSNLTGSIDLAFLDRADIVQYIGNPMAHGIYEIYRSALDELISTEIITQAPQDERLPPYEIAIASNEPSTTVDMLLQVAKLSEGLSGRTLRKIPFVAHAQYVRKESESLLNFLTAMRQAVRRLKVDKDTLETCSHRRHRQPDIGKLNLD